MSSETSKRSVKKDLQMIRRGCGLIKEISPGLLGLSLLKSLLYALTPYIAIFMSALIIDELVGKKDFNLLIIYVVITVGGTLVMTIITDIITSKVNVMNTMFDVKFENYLNTVKFSMDFRKLEDPKYTELRDTIMRTMFSTGGGITGEIRMITTIVENFISIVIAIYILIKAMWGFATLGIGISSVVNSIWFTLLLAVVLIVCIAFTIRNSKTVNIKEFKLFQNMASINSYLQYYHYYYLEDDQAGKDVHIFDQRQLIVEEVLTKGRMPLLKSLSGKYSLYQKYLSVNSAISALIGGLAYIYIGLKALSGAISLGNVTKCYAAIIRLVSAVGSFSASLTNIISNNNYLEMLYEFIDLPSETQEGKEVPINTDEDWEIEFHNVSFRYPSCEQYTLKDISMKISSNSRTAIVGMNGSGKTTMIKLLCGFYNPESGYITLNGKNIREYDKKAYQKLFSVVFQDFKLLAFPIGQNVAASYEYDEKKVWDSLRTAGVEERVREFPNGINQSITKDFDEEGIDVSGGEEQKLAIARALYKDAPFIVLDEPTAALDPVAEYDIYSKFNEIIGDKAAVFVSHRLSSCRFCDTIVVFHNGQIVQFGTHDQLLENEKGKYSELWNAQAQYYET